MEGVCKTYTHNGISRHVHRTMGSTRVSAGTTPTTGTQTEPYTTAGVLPGAAYIITQQAWNATTHDNTGKNSERISRKLSFYQND